MCYFEDFDVFGPPTDGFKVVFQPDWACRGFKGAVKKSMLASRFILCARTPLANELDTELEQLLSWDDFNVNRIAQLSDRQPLLLVGLSALNHFGLLQTLQISNECAIDFIKAVEHHYMCDFHTSVSLLSDPPVCLASNCCSHSCPGVIITARCPKYTPPYASQT